MVVLWLGQMQLDSPVRRLRDNAKFRIHYICGGQIARVIAIALIEFEQTHQKVKSNEFRKIQNSP